TRSKDELGGIILILRCSRAIGDQTYPSEGGVLLSIDLLHRKGPFPQYRIKMSTLELVELKRYLVCHNKSTTLASQEKGREYETWEERVEYLRVVLQVLMDSHHPGKANVVVNTLSRKPLDSTLACKVTLKSMKLGTLKVTGDLIKVGKICKVITYEKSIGVKIRIDEVLRFYDKIHFFDVIDLRKLIL
ncbi:hypothetical protein CR513_51632, partial [Mucuna pruriens]